MNIIILFLIFSILFFMVLIMKNTTEKFNNKNDFIISMFLTGGLKEEAENCIHTLKNHKLDDKLIVTALDDEAYQYISKLNVKTEKRKTNLKNEADFGTKDFYEITYNKLDIIKQNLEKYNKVVIYSDTDIVFLQDITDDVNKFISNSADILIQDDSPNFKNSTNYCSGFMIFKPNKICIEVLEEAKRIMKENWDKRGGGKLADQKAIQESMNNLKSQNKTIKLELLDLKEYPNGARYFNNINTIYKTHKPKIVHNNYIVGTKNKIERFKKNNLWFI